MSLVTANADELTSAPREELQSFSEVGFSDGRPSPGVPGPSTAADASGASSLSIDLLVQLVAEMQQVRDLLAVPPPVPYYERFNIARTVTLKRAPGSVGGVFSLKQPIGFDGTMTLFDGMDAANGKVIALLQPDATGAFPVNVSFLTGLTVQLAGTTVGEWAVAYT